MDYAVIGVSHHTAPVELRERLAVPESRLAEACERLQAPPGGEWMLLSTCNRLEVITHGLGDGAFEHAMAWMKYGSGLREEELASVLRVFRGDEAIAHTFRVAAGLDSMVLGEPQILGQWKTAFQRGIELGTVGSMLQRLGQRTLQVAKKVRTDTDIGRYAVNMASLAVELAEEVFEPLSEKRVLVLGAGEMAELAIVHFRARGIARMTICNRTLARAESLAADHGASARPWEAWSEELPESDVVIVGAGAGGHLLTADDVRRALKGAPRRPRVIIDLAVPRAVDPEVAGFADLFLYSVDDFAAISRDNRQRRLEEADAAERLVAESVERFSVWYGQQTLAPLLGDLGRALERIRSAEVSKTLRRIGDRTPEALVDAATEAVTRRLHQRLAMALREQPDEALTTLVRLLAAELANETETG